MKLKFEEAIVVPESERRSIVDSIDFHSIEVEPQYNGARIGGDVVTLNCVKKMMDDFRNQKFLHKWYDKAKKGVLNGYFLWSTIGYGSGVFFTYLGLYLMNGHGQPALLYLVPCTLGVSVILGLVRGELKDLWNYGTDD
ncbi:signal peptide peptidase-like 3 isoform X2 [Camellia sinensis]|nr:signal peptide peptidase-like 3 isoform X2 [Camellia sinensis]